MKENKRAPTSSASRLDLRRSATRHVPGSQVRRGRGEGRRVLPRSRLHHARSVGAPELKVARATRTTRRRAGSSCGFRSPKGERYKVGSFDVRRQHRRQDRRPASRCSRSKPGEYYSEKKIRKGLEKAREVYGAGGYFEFTGFPDYKFRDDPNPTEPEAPDALKAPEPPKPRPAPADRRRDDADAGRAAVLRQPHHLHRQHDDARQRHPARDAAGRGRRLQHRGAEVQRQAAESARLLQAARRHGKDVDVEKTPGDDEQGRRQAEARGAEPQPAHLRRRRLASSKASSASCRSRPRTSSAAARA